MPRAARTRPPSKAGMPSIRRAVNAVKAFGNTPATPDEARRMLGIPAFDGGRVRAALGID